MLFFIFENFKKKIEKIKVLAHRGAVDIFGSHMCTFLIQMCEFLYLSFAEVKIWCFPSFLKTFEKFEKIEVFAHCVPVDIFGSIHTCTIFIQMNDFFII